MRNRDFEYSSAERARWMAELAAALEDAQRVAWRLAQDSRSAVEALELYGRIEAARVDLDALRAGRMSATRNHDVDWQGNSPWCRPNEAGA